MKTARHTALFLRAAVLSAVLSACSGTPAVSDEPAKANRFPLTVEEVNGTLEENGISLRARDVQEIEAADGVKQMAYILYSLDSESNKTFGMAYTNLSEDGSGVGLSVDRGKIPETDVTDEKLIMAVLDLYGEFADRQAIADKVLKSAESGDLRIYKGDGYNARTFCYLKAGGANLTFDFIRRDDGYILYRGQVMDDAMFNYSLARNARAGYRWAADLQSEISG